MTQSGHGQQLTACAVVQEIEGRRQAHSWWLVEVIGAAINCHLQLALLSKGAEKVQLHKIVDVDEVVGDETDQKERTGVINVIEKRNTDCRVAMPPIDAA
jgi:hypothetical protein